MKQRAAVGSTAGRETTPSPHGVARRCAKSFEREAKGAWHLSHVAATADSLKRLRMRAASSSSEASKGGHRAPGPLTDWPYSSR